MTDILIWDELSLYIWHPFTTLSILFNSVPVPFDLAHPSCCLSPFLFHSLNIHFACTLIFFVAPAFLPFCFFPFPFSSFPCNFTSPFWCPLLYFRISLFPLSPSFQSLCTHSHIQFIPSLWLISIGWRDLRATADHIVFILFFFSHRIPPPLPSVQLLEP